MTNLIPAKFEITPEQDESTPGIERIERADMLQPGCYWRVTKAIEAAEGDRWSRKLREGDVHLLLSVFVFDDAAHSVDILCHPRDGRDAKLTLLLPDFLSNLEPVQEEEALAVRAREQAEIMEEVSSIQEEMSQATINPLSLPAVQEAAQEAVEEFEEQESSRVLAEVKDKERRDADLRRIHRRAARRSSAKGNPIAVRRAAISDKVEVMINEGISSDGVRELTLEGGRRIAIAQAASKFLTRRADEMGRLLKSMTPYFAERAQLALAKASDAIQMVNDLNAGIRSLRLYTGDAVDVATILTGDDAPESDPLTLIQVTRYMDEELAVWADVQDKFDWSDQGQFFEELKKSPGLLEQVLPLQRCVVSMAVTRRNVRYSDSMHWYDRMMAEIANKQVFLLVRNGANVHVVYSDEPTHEAAARLFPSNAEISAPFRGVDGSAIGLNDVRFSKASENFEETGLIYKRFLILLAGLDHREKLFGRFYPDGEAIRFMSLAFQQRYFRFLADEDEVMLEHGTFQFQSPTQWIEWCNSHVRSGSRIIFSSAAAGLAVPRKHKKGYRLAAAQLSQAHIASVSKGFHFIQLGFENSWSSRGDRVEAPVWLDGPDAPEIQGTWFLCMDRVTMPLLRRFLFSRRHRSSDLSWLRVLRRAESIVRGDLENESVLREHLRNTAIEHGVRAQHDVDDAVDAAISIWRAARRGAAAPSLQDTKAVNELLTLVYPKDAQLVQLRDLAEHLADRIGCRPLRLSRTAKGRFALYVESPQVEIDSVRGAVQWRWVHRHSVVSKGGRLTSTSSSPFWIDSTNPVAAEEIVADWEEFETWSNKGPEPIRLSEVMAFIEDLRQAEALKPMLQAGSTVGSSIPEDLQLTEEASTGIIQAMRKLLSGRSYYQTVIHLVPVGIVQSNPLVAPKFIYAVAHASRFMARFASKEKLDDFTVHYSTSQQAKASAKKPLVWMIASLTQRQNRTTAMVATLQGEIEQPPKWMRYESQRPGGISRKSRSDTRAARRAEGGAPKHSSSDAMLSPNRAFDTLMGLNPAISRDFYRAVEERVDRIWGFGEEQESVNAKRKAERSRRYEPSVPCGAILSSLVWDAAHSHSNANAIFANRSKARRRFSYQFLE